MHEVELIRLTTEYLSKLGFTSIEVEPVIRGAQPDLVVYSDNSSTRRPIIVAELKRQLPQEVELLHPAVQRAFQYAALIGNTHGYLLISDGKNHHWFQLKDNGTSLDYSAEPEPTHQSISEEGKLDNRDRMLRATVRSILGSLSQHGIRVDIRAARDVLRVIVAWAVCHGDQWRHELGYFADPRPEIIRMLSKYLSSLCSRGEDWTLPLHIVRDAFSQFQRLSRSCLLSQTRARLFWAEIAPLLIESDQTWCSPKVLARFMVDLVAPRPGERFIDPACGTGQFIVESFLHLLRPNGIKDIEDPVLSDIPKVLFGWERNPVVAEVALLNAILAGLGNRCIENKDALDISDIAVEHSIFDVVISDPPVGRFTPSNGPDSIARNRQLRTTETAFVQRAVELLRVGGRAALLLPEGFFFSHDRTSFRKWLLHNVHLKAVISLPPGAWTTARSHTQASVLVFEKGVPPPEYSVFVADLRSRQNEITDTENLQSRLVAVNRAFERFSRDQAGFLAEDIGDRIEAISSDLFSAERIDVAGVTLESWRRSPASVSARYSVARLSEVADIILGKHIRRKGDDEDDFAAKYIQAGNVRRFQIELDEAPRLSANDVATVEGSRLMADDVLITSTGQYLGRCAIVNEDTLPAIASNAVTILRVRDRSLLDPRFLVAFLNSPAGVEQFEQRRIKGVAQPYLRRGDIEAILVALPPLEVQRAAAAKIWNLLARADEMEAKALSMKARAHTLLLDVLGKELIR